MGSDSAGAKRRSRASYRRAVAVGFLPFLLGLLSIAAFVRHYQTGLPVRRAGAGDGQAAGLPRADCSSLPAPAHPPCNCSTSSAGGGLGQAGANSTDVLQLAGKLSKTSVEAVLDAANATDPVEQSVRVNEDRLEDVFLFIGILSGRGYRHRRLAVREAWANRCQLAGISVCRFVLSQDEITPQVQKEVDQHGDIVFVGERTNYKSILVKTFFILEYAVAHYGVRYIMKTDDDAFVAVPPLLAQLRQLCESPGCLEERVYMGRMAKESEVLLQPGHKWNNMVFFNHTGLRTYPHYMMGGGYVLSGDVAKNLLATNRMMRLKFTPIEDATVGFWLMSMDLRFIDHARFFTFAGPCCFKAPVRREGQRIVTRFQLSEETEADLCSADPWLVLHKIDSPTKMRYIGNRMATCNGSAADPESVPPSLAPFMRLRGAGFGSPLWAPTIGPSHVVGEGGRDGAA